MATDATPSCVLRHGTNVIRNRESCVAAWHRIKGVVEEHDERSGMTSVVFDSGRRKWIDLQEEEYEVLIPGSGRNCDRSSQDGF